MDWKHDATAEVASVDRYVFTPNLRLRKNVFLCDFPVVSIVLYFIGRLKPRCEGRSRFCRHICFQTQPATSKKRISCLFVHGSTNNRRGQNKYNHTKVHMINILSKGWLLIHEVCGSSHFHLHIFDGDTLSMFRTFSIKFNANITMCKILIKAALIDDNLSNVYRLRDDTTWSGSFLISGHLILEGGTPKPDLDLILMLRYAKLQPNRITISHFKMCRRD